MSELILTLAGVVAFALVHAAHPRRFPFGDRWWRALAGPLGSARRALYALATTALLLGAWGGSRSLGAAETALILLAAVMTAGSVIVLAVPLWPRATWRLCAGCAVALPLLLIAQVLHA
jgi:hypothetical protein